MNAAIYESNRARPIAEVLERWRQVHQEVLEAVQAMSEEQLFQSKIDWLGSGSFAEAVPGNSYEHLQHHAGDIRTWLAAKKSAAAG